jgi:RNA polymerase primary sigma factor
MKRSTKRGGKAQATEPTLTSNMPDFPETDHDDGRGEGRSRRGMFRDDHHPDSDFEPSEEHADALPMLSEDGTPPAEGEGDDPHAPDDALGLYLRQMGAIPLLTRDQEYALAERLAFRRGRFRRAALASWRTIAKVVETFERVLGGHLALDPTIDVVGTLGLTRDKILARMPQNIKTLRGILALADDGFRNVLKATTVNSRTRARRELARRLRRASTLVEELSPRSDLLDHWTAELRELSRMLS